MFFLYDLMLGPLFSLSTSGKIPHSVFRSFYEPVFRVERKVFVLDSFNNWYFAIWDRARKRSSLDHIAEIYRIEQTNQSLTTIETNAPK